MRTVKSTIIEELSDGEWKDKQEICSQVSYTFGCYGETCGRKLRELAVKGVIEKRSNTGKRGTMYRLVTDKIIQEKIEHIKEVMKPIGFQMSVPEGKLPEPDFNYLKTM